MSGAENSQMLHTTTKSEAVDFLQVPVKTEKMDYDSSATASADEGHNDSSLFLEAPTTEDNSTHPLSKVSWRSCLLFTYAVAVYLRYDRPYWDTTVSLIW